jgi:hypothetical protein
MEMMIILGVKFFFFSWLLTRFQPIQMLLEALPGNLLCNVFKLLFTCLMCMSFWTTLIYTGDFMFASVMAFIGFWYDKIIGFYENRVRLK